MEIEQDEIMSILAKRFERKHLSILLFFSIDIIATLMPENLDITNELLYNIGMLVSCILLIKLFVLYIQGIKDFIKNGKTNDLNEFLQENEYSIEEIHSALDELENNGIIIKKGVCKTYGNIFLT